MIKYVVFKPCRYGGVFAENYWTGEITDKRRPAQTNKTYGALQFDTARDAYDEAGKHDQLALWRVGRRQVEAFH